MAQKSAVQLKRSQLSKVATELNDVLGLEPGINPKAKIDELKEKIMEAGGVIDPEADELSEDTWKIMEALGAVHRPAQEYVPQHEEESEEAEIQDDRNMVAAKQDLENDAGDTPERGGEEQAEEPQEGNIADISASENTVEAKQEPEVENENVHVESEEQSEPAKSDDGKKDQDEKSKKPKQQKVASNSNKSGPASKSKRFADDQVITILVEENPKRSGSKCCDRFNLYKSGITVKQYVEAGGKRDDVRWDSERGYIQVQ